MSNTQLGRVIQDVLTNKSGGAHAEGDVCILDASNAGAVINTTTSGDVSNMVWVCIEPNGVANNGTGMYACAGPVRKINLASSASIGDFVKTHTVAKQGTPHATPMVAGDFAQVKGTGTSPAAVLFTVKSSVSTGVARSGATTDAHLAVWNGSNADSIKDGGAVPAGGSSVGQTLSYPTTFTGDTINGSSTTPFVDVVAFDTKEVLNSRVLHLKTLGDSKNQRVRVTLGTTKAGAFDVTACMAFTQTYWSAAIDTYLEYRLSTSADAQIAIARLYISEINSVSGAHQYYNAVRVGGSSISSANVNIEHPGPIGSAYTIRMVRDGSNVIKFNVGIGTLPLCLAPVTVIATSLPFSATVSGTLERIEFSIHTPLGPGATVPADAFIDYVMSL